MTPENESFTPLEIVEANTYPLMARLQETMPDLPLDTVAVATLDNPEEIAQYMIERCESYYEQHLPIDSDTEIAKESLYSNPIRLMRDAASYALKEKSDLWISYLDEFDAKRMQDLRDKIDAA